MRDSAPSKKDGEKPIPQDIKEYLKFPHKKLEAIVSHQIDNECDPPEIMLETKWKGLQNNRWFKCSKLIDKM